LSPQGRTPSATYATVTRQYLPAVILVIGLSVAISAARRAVAPGLTGIVGDLVEAVGLAVVAITVIGLAIVRPFERRMHDRRRASAERERAYRGETERRDFERRVATGLDLCENETDLLTTAQRAMGAATGGAPTELLLASPARGTFERTISSGDAPPGCTVDDPSGCPATRRGAAQCFSDSDAIDACPWLRGRRQGRLGAVCVPVSITGRALGVLHTIHDIGNTPSPAAVEQLTALADHVGARIGMLRLTAAATRGGGDLRLDSPLMEGTGVGRPATDGAPEESGAVAGADAAGLPRDHEVAGMGAATPSEESEGAPDGAVQPDLLGRVE
jgi:hypothetical protein